MKFLIKPHSLRPNTEVVEVFDDYGHFIATVTSGDAGHREIRVISKYIKGQYIHDDERRRVRSPAVIIQFTHTEDEP